MYDQNVLNKAFNHSNMQVSDEHRHIEMPYMSSFMHSQTIIFNLIKNLRMLQYTSTNIIYSKHNFISKSKSITEV